MGYGVSKGVFPVRVTVSVVQNCPEIVYLAFKQMLFNHGMIVFLRQGVLCFLTSLIMRQKGQRVQNRGSDFGFLSPITQQTTANSRAGNSAEKICKTLFDLQYRL